MMHARVISITAYPGTVDELVATLHDRVLPAARAQTGFRGAVVLGDPAARSAMVISFWQHATQERMSMHAVYLDELLRRPIVELGYEYGLHAAEVLLAEWPHQNDVLHAGGGP